MWTKLVIIVVFLINLFGCSGKHYTPFTEEGINRQLTATILTGIDWRQTQKIVSNPGLHELNPLLGRHPSRDKVDIFVPLSILAQWGLVYYLPRKYRKHCQRVMIGAELLAVSNNYSIGIRIDY